jgi:hypothetical protein
MKWKTLALLGALIVAATAVEVSNHASPLVISANFGGSIATYMEDYAQVRHAKTEIKLEDVCISACTMVLGLIPLDRVCADKRALFGFHSAWVMGPFGPVFSREGTRMVWNLYPKSVQEELVKRGWNGEGNEPHPDLLYVPATEFVRECNG